MFVSHTLGISGTGLTVGVFQPSVVTLRYYLVLILARSTFKWVASRNPRVPPRACSV